MIERLGTFTRWPEPSERARLRDRFRQITGLDGVIGAIDGTHIPFLQRPKTDNANAMYTYKRRYAFVVQGVADCNVQIRNYFIMSTASIHDAAVYRKSPLCSFPSAFFEPDEFLLRDAAYPCGEHLLTPFSGRSVFSDPQIADFFNEHHGAGRVFIERAWGLLKARFQCLRCLRQQSIEYAFLVIQASLLLHNFLIEKRLEDPTDLDFADANGTEFGKAEQPAPSPPTLFPSHKELKEAMHFERGTFVPYLLESLCGFSEGSIVCKVMRRFNKQVCGQTRQTHLRYE